MTRPEPRIAGLRRFFRLPLSRRTIEREVDDELRFHLESRVAELIARGATPADAREQAAREFGDVAASRGELMAIEHRRLRRDRRAAWWDAVAQDVRTALRSWRWQPAFTATVLLTLALGIGATTAVFTVVDAALLRPFPYRDADRLVHLWETQRGASSVRSAVSWPDFLDWRAQSDEFAALEGYDPANVAIEGAEGALMVRGARITTGFFEMLGVVPIAGRGFGAIDEVAGGAPVVIVSESLARGRFGDPAAAPGGTLLIDRSAYAIVGVLPAGFHFAPLQDADVWLPLDPAAGRNAPRDNRWLRVVGRVRDGVTPEQARTGLAPLMARLGQAHPATHAGRGIAIVALRDELVGPVRPILLALFGAAVLVLVIACVNAASLLTARALGRGREMAIRAALGASQGRIARQLLVEGMLLSSVAGAIGVWIAWLGSKALVAAIPPGISDSLPYLGTLPFDARVLAVSAIVVLGTGVIFGLVPLASAVLRSPADAMRRGDPRAEGSRPRLRRALVAAQLAMTLVLLTGAGLMTRSFLALTSVPLGFETERVLAAQISLQGARYAPADEQRRFYERLVDGVREIAGVRSAGVIGELPLGGGGTTAFTPATTSGRDAPGSDEALLREVAGDYFATMGIRVTAGRTFGSADGEGAPLVLVVSETLARHHFGGRSAIGERLRLRATPDTTWTIVGVVADVKTASLDAPAPPTIYVSHLQLAENRMALVVRAVPGVDPWSLVPAIRRIVRQLDDQAPVYAISTLAGTIATSRALFVRRYPMLLIGSFALVALVLATIGVYGLLSFTVARRRREIALRLALGASRANIIGDVLGDTGRIAAWGIGAGLLAAVWSSRALGALLYGVPPTDLPTYGSVALLLLGVAMLATAGPARRAAAVDPASALRGEG